jgi:hypothetical protein
MANASATTSTPSPGGASGRRRGFKIWFRAVLIGALLLVVLWTLMMLSWNYSEGERAGILQKFSKRGWVCKTYEGELAMYVVGGIAPQIWDFSVRDEAVAQQLHKAVGRQVRLHYSEHPGLPTTCFGETGHFVEQVEIVDAPEVVAPSSGLTIVPASPGAPPAGTPPATPQGKPRG